ncbi:MAG: hypothetical protein H0U75_11395 [Legionella sp.]|nr:hypothetical protein [Legionella sp.]
MSIFTSGVFILIGDFDTNPFLIKSGQYIWDHIPSTDVSPVVHSAREDYLFSHGLSCIRQQGDQAYLYEFATKRNNSDINSFYTNYYNCIEHFIHYFNDKAKPLIMEGLKSPLQITLQPTVYNVRNVYPEFDKEAFLESLNIKHFYLKGDNAYHYLTPSELECFLLLNKGMSQKQVAWELKKSRRTIEHYLSNAKERCECTLPILQDKIRELYCSERLY